MKCVNAMMMSSMYVRKIQTDLSTYIILCTQYISIHLCMNVLFEHTVTATKTRQLNEKKQGKIYLKTKARNNNKNSSAPFCLDENEMKTHSDFYTTVVLIYVLIVCMCVCYTHMCAGSKYKLCGGDHVT